MTLRILACLALCAAGCGGTTWINKDYKGGLPGGGERPLLLPTDVHQFPGHIVCDPASRSELVVPMIEGGHLVGVFDLDSPLPGRFTTADQLGIEAAVRLLLGACRWRDRA